MIKNKKLVPLDKFIYKSLYDKSKGYYFKKNPFGKEGDFITAPNISKLFSEILSIWTILFWKNLKKPKKINLIELGGGNGEMIFQMGLAQDMFDFKNTKAIIDPITDELILVKTDENGNPTNEVVNVSQLGTLSSQQELEYNYRQEIQNRIKGSGTKKYRDKNTPSISHQ